YGKSVRVGHQSGGDKRITTGGTSGTEGDFVGRKHDECECGNAEFHHRKENFHEDYDFEQ
ncbi:hypothetical protein, partial [Bacillus licheniformis]|uniref:hypothetical protein n=1 Tax=Bacillus licheniformis TaxID=1402 RepID=UPI0021AB5378